MVGRKEITILGGAPFFDMVSFFSHRCFQPRSASRWDETPAKK